MTSKMSSFDRSHGNEILSSYLLYSLHLILVRYHICLDIDRDEQKLSVAVNGEVLETFEEVESLAETRPGSLVIGDFDDRGLDMRFHWSVTNLNLFSSLRPSGDLTSQLSRDLCSFPGVTNRLAKSYG